LFGDGAFGDNLSRVELSKPSLELPVKRSAGHPTGQMCQRFLQYLSFNLLIFKELSVRLKK
jgi:hypothetical protein